MATWHSVELSIHKLSQNKRQSSVFFKTSSISGRKVSNKFSLFYYLYHIISLSSKPNVTSTEIQNCKLQHEVYTLRWLKVSGAEYKVFGSCHSSLTTWKKLNKWKNQQLFLDPWSMTSYGKLLLSKLKRQVTIENANKPEKKLINRNLHKNKCQSRKFWTILDKLLETQSVQVWLMKNYGDGVCNSIMGKGNILWVLPSEALLVSHSEYQRKIPRCF